MQNASPAVTLSHETRRRLMRDFAAYAAFALKIRSKDGTLRPLRLNRAQQSLHREAVKQRRETGRVRLIIVKGRQQGCSTYVQARFYWRLTHAKHRRAFILTHCADSTAHLFEMTARFHAHCPPLLKPRTGRANARALSFQLIDSAIGVGTAGAAAVGRGATLQLFHGSEVAFWPNAAEHVAGALQAVPPAEGTEIFLESTAQGEGGAFHDMWRRAVEGASDFRPVFIPWFWQDEYETKPPADFSPLPEERELAKLFALRAGQLYWRRRTIAQLGGLSLFQREYPSTPEEGFAASGEASVMPPDIVRAAVARAPAPNGPAIWGLDVARFGADRSALAKRRGPALDTPVLSWRGLDTMQLAGMVKSLYDGASGPEKPIRIFVDAIGLGAGVADRLRELGLPAEDVNVAESAAQSERYRRRRDELWFLARAWLAQPNTTLIDDAALIEELLAPRFRYDSNGRIQVESKEAMAKRGGLGGASPDLADALMLTFAGGETAADWSRALPVEPRRLG
jgi:hypothetical protein